MRPPRSGGRATLRAALSLLALSLALPAAASAQSTLHGQVFHGGEPLPSIPVTLHRVTPDTAGPIATTTTDGEGRFEFHLPPPGSAAFTVFFATAEYQGVRYFGQPIHPGESPAQYPIEAFDTTSKLSTPARVSRRDLVLLPLTGGGWEVNEVVTVLNPENRTLVPSGGLPSWELKLPETATDFQAGQGEVVADDVRQMGDRILLLTPLIPGSRDLFLRYRLPPQRKALEIPVSAPTDTFNVFVRQPAPEMTLTGMGAPTQMQAAGETFVRYEGLDLPPESTLSLSWVIPGLPPFNPIYAGIAATVVVLLVGAWMAYRARTAAASASPPSAAAPPPGRVSARAK